MSKEMEDLYLEDDFEDDGVQIDWPALMQKAYSHRKAIFIATVAVGILGCMFALMRKHIWRVTVTLAPEVQNSVRTASSLKSITNILGVGNASLANSTDALNITLAPEICASTPFLVQLFDMEINPKLPQDEIDEGAKNGPMTMYVYLTKKYMPEKPKSAFRTWVESVLSPKEDGQKEEDSASGVNIARLTKEQDKVRKMLSRCIAVDVDNKSGVTTIQVTMTDPEIATALADTVCSRLQRYITAYRTQKARQDYEYYVKIAEEARQKMIDAQIAYAHSVDYDRSVILQSVASEKDRLEQEASLAQQLYAQMKSQEDAYRAKVQELRPVFAIIQPATRPLRPADSRKTFVLAFTFLGFVCSSGWFVFLKDFIRNTKMKLKEGNYIENQENTEIS